MQDGQFGQGGANVQNPQGPGHLFEVGGFFPHPAAQFLKQGRLVFISGDSLTEADFSLSATWFPGVAAAVLEILKLYPVIAHQKPELPVPRGRALEVGEKGPGAGAVPAFLTHNLYSCRLALGLNVPAVWVTTSSSTQSSSSSWVASSAFFRASRGTATRCRSHPSP
jgi:hypothetical protein